MAELWQRGRVVLTWSPEHELHGLEVVMRRRTMAELNAQALSEQPDSDKPWEEMTGKERAARSERTASELAQIIVKWNLADANGEPVPVTTRGVLANCDPPMINDMWQAYNAGTARVAPPLPQSSDDGPEDWGPSDLPPQEVIDHPV